MSASQSSQSTEAKQEYYIPQQPITSQPPAQLIVQQVQASTPLASLQKESRIVDCPICGTQQMTTTEYVRGNTTT